MNNRFQLLLFFELIWWIGSLAILSIVLLPIFKNIVNYPFFYTNTLFVLSFLLLIRYIFFLRLSWLAKKQIIKLILLFLSLALTFHLISELNFFQTYLDEKGLEQVIGNLNLKQTNNMSSYIRNEMVFFGVGSIISSILFPIRMMISIWMVHNRVSN